MRRILGSIAIFSVASPALWADTITLKNGSELGGVVTERTAESLTVRIEGGEMTFPAAMVGSVESGGLTIEGLESKERSAQSALALASAERRLNVLRELEARETGRARAAQAVPAALTGGLPKATDTATGPSEGDAASTIPAKLEILKSLLPELQKTGFPEQERLRDAVLSDLFPNYRSPVVVW